MPDAGTLIGDKGSDSGAFRKALIQRGITPCIPLARPCVAVVSLTQLVLSDSLTLRIKLFELIANSNIPLPPGSARF